MAVRHQVDHRVGQPSSQRIGSSSPTAESPRRRDTIETIGHYNPRTDPVEIQIASDKARSGFPRRPALDTVVGSSFAGTSCPQRSREGSVAKDCEYCRPLPVDDPAASRSRSVASPKEQVIEMHVAETTWARSSAATAASPRRPTCQGDRRARRAKPVCSSPVSARAQPLSEH